MIRVSYSATSGAQRWNLCGDLAGPWVDELRAAWEYAQRGAASYIFVDLRDVNFIDQAGEKLLAEMKHAGAQFMVAGVENKHLLANLSNDNQQTGAK